MINWDSIDLTERKTVYRELIYKFRRQSQTKKSIEQKTESRTLTLEEIACANYHTQIRNRLLDAVPAIYGFVCIRPADQKLINLSCVGHRRPRQPYAHTYNGDGLRRNQACRFTRSKPY